MAVSLFVSLRHKKTKINHDLRGKKITKSYGDNIYRAKIFCSNILSVKMLLFYDVKKRQTNVRKVYII